MNEKQFIRAKAFAVLECMAIDLTGALAESSKTSPMTEVLEERLEAIDTAQAALREQPRWISVEERLPERRGHYFIAYKFADSDMRFYGEAMWHDDVPDNGYVQGNHFANEGLHGMRVTHWMEIPELPPEVVNNGD